MNPASSDHERQDLVDTDQPAEPVDRRAVTHPLALFCEVAQQVLKEARELLADCPTPEAFSPDLVERYKTLYLRARKPEVKVLVLGPLKAGKSTLLNVVAGNPHISQISQLPAYPCFIEVRSLERDGRGVPVEEPCSLFLKRDGTMEMELSHQDGIEFLDHLLDEFIRSGPDAAVEYERVVQKVDFPSGVPGVDLVLIDSPGLFFSRRVDDSLFGRLDGESSPAAHVSGTVETIYRETDVVIFVIRPEQLFFQSAIEYLRDFTRGTKMRVFILVNASTHSKTQLGNEIVDYDQVERQHEIREYFLRHVAGEDLNEEIRDGDRVSLVFADLLDAATALFAPRGDPETFLASPSGRVVEQMRDYLFGQDLTLLKVEDLRRGTADLMDHTCDHLGLLVGRWESKRRQALRDSQGLSEKIDEVGLRLDRMKSRRDDVQRRLDDVKERIRLTRAFIEDGELPGESRDPVFSEFLDLAELESRRGSQPDVFAPATRENAKRIIVNIYKKWLDKAYGRRTLRSLAEALWESKIEGDLQSLRVQSEKNLSAICQELIRLKSGRLRSGELKDALAKVDPFRVEVRRANPLLSSSDFPLLKFRSRWTLRRKYWQSGFRITPRALWGDDGKRVIEDPDEEKILIRERQKFLRQIWGPAWQLGLWFTSEHLQRVARRIILAKISRNWGIKLSDDLATQEGKLAAIQSRVEEVDRELAQWLDKEAKLAGRIKEADEMMQDLKKRQAEFLSIRQALNRVASGIHFSRRGEGPPVETHPEEPITETGTAVDPQTHRPAEMADE